MKKLFIPIVLLISAFIADAQHSIARKWNEVLLEGIRNDFARPTVHARNLFQISAAMYDAWAVFSPTDHTYLLGKEVHGFLSPFEGFDGTANEIEDLILN